MVTEEQYENLLTRVKVAEAQITEYNLICDRLENERDMALMRLDGAIEQLSEIMRRVTGPMITPADTE